MPKPYRRLLFYCFLGCFLVFAPLLILYASGYRYNWNRGRIQETGVLKIEYKPKNARIILNDEPHRAQTPATIGGLIPGRYSIEVAAEGYRSWKKKLWIEPSRTTFTQHMILWKTAPEPVPLYEKPIALLSANNRGIIAFTTHDGQRDRLFIADPERATRVEVPLNEAFRAIKIQSLVWSPNGRRLYVETTNGATVQKWIWSSADATLVPLAQIAGATSLSNVRWSVDDDDVLYGFTRQTTPRQGFRLTEIDLFRGNARALTYTTPGGITSSYIVDGGLLYRTETLTTDGEPRTLLIITPLTETARAVERRIPLPQRTDHVTFLPSPDQFITLLDNDHKTLFIIDKETRALYPVQETIEGVTDAVWSPKKNRLLWSTGKELWLLDLELSRREQLHAEQQKIQEILWHPGNEYIFYGVSDDIRVLEIDGRDERNIETLATIPNRSGLSISQSGEFITTIGTEGLVTLRVTE